MSGIKPKPKRATERLRIEPVDNWHAAWSDVLRSIERVGNAKKLQIDADGWLSARQIVLVTFAGKKVAAHLCFSISPSRSGCVEARLDSHGIEKSFCGRGIEAPLLQAAVERARALGCSRLRGFRLNKNWC